MESPDNLAKNETKARLAQLGKDRAWLAEQLSMTEGVVNQWLAPKGYFPLDRQKAVKLLLDKVQNPVRIGDPEGNLISFTIEEFERIEATRQMLHYETRPALYRDAILAFVEQDEEAQREQAGKVVPLPAAEMLKAAETPESPPVTEERREVRYQKRSKGKDER